MKNLLLAFVVFVYAVPDTFDFEGFLASCLANGVKLYAIDKTDSPNGDVMLLRGELTVNLHEDSVAAIPPNLAKGFKGQAGRVALPSDPKTGGLKAYKPTIDAAVAANLGTQ